MHACCWSQGWLQLLEKSSLADPALCMEFSAQSPLFFLCLQYLLVSEQSQQQVPFGAKRHDLVLGTASIMV